LLSFTDTVFPQVDVLGTFVGEYGRPINASLVVIVDSSASIGFWHVKVSGAKFDV